VLYSNWPFGGSEKKVAQGILNKAESMNNAGGAMMHAAGAEAMLQRQEAIAGM